MTHIVLIKPKATADATAVEDLRQALSGLQEVIPGLTSFSWGANVSPEGKAQGYELGFIMTFSSTADRDAYLPHPAHVAVVPLIRRIADDVLVFDLEA